MLLACIDLNVYYGISFCGMLIFVGKSARRMASPQKIVDLPAYVATTGVRVQLVDALCLVGQMGILCNREAPGFVEIMAKAGAFPVTKAFDRGHLAF